MDFPGLNFRPGKVVEAEILRRHGLPVCHVPALRFPEFFLVLSFGRCKYRLSEQSAATILQAVIGGAVALFRVTSLGDRIFRFSVSSRAVGFHIYNLHSYECSNFKIFFNLWHGGGPNYKVEYRRWEAEEQAKWTTVGKNSSSSSVHPPPLTRANSIPVRNPVHGVQVQNSNPAITPSAPNSNPVNAINQSARIAIFNCIQFGRSNKNSVSAIPLHGRRGILGKYPLHLANGPLFCVRCLAHDHNRPNYPNQLRCNSCFRYGHPSASCRFPPRTSRPTGQGSCNFDLPRISRPKQTMTSGAREDFAPRRFTSFGEYFTSLTGRPAPSPITVTWGRAWSIKAPDFPDDGDEGEDDQAAIAASSASSPPVFTSFGEIARTVLGFQSTLKVTHVYWYEKTPVAIVTSSPSSQNPQSSMAYHFIDPTPFLPHGTQHQMINGRPLMRCVVAGHVPQRNNDLVIATFNPMLQGQIDFVDICNVLHDFLRNHARVGYRTMQPCPHGQAFVHLNYLLDKDLLIDNSPHQYGNGTISFVAHDRAWNNRTAIFTHEVWLMLLGLDFDLWTQPLLEKAVSPFGQLLIWEEDPHFMSRAIIKVRVSDLEEISWFFVFTEGTDFESNSWSMQCEVLHTRMLGGPAQDEDLPQGNDDFNPNAFFYHGFGQFGQGPPPPLEDPPAPFILENLQAMG